MGELKAWNELDPHTVGLVVLQALHNAERGILGQVEGDLGGRWVRISTSRMLCRVVVEEIETPLELAGDGKEVG